MMATTAETIRAEPRDDGFFLWGGIAMALVLVAGFSIHLAAGRSSFSAPWYVHAHAAVFFGWVALYTTQTILGATGSLALHRKLGWIGAGYLVVMVFVGTWVTVEVIRHGRIAPFFTPAYFLIFGPLGIYTFAGLTAAAIRLRRSTDWHRRLHFCGMAILTSPGLGRLIPLPLFMPYAHWVEAASIMVFPLAGVLYDLRRTGRVHPAWWWGIGTILAMRLVIALLVMSPFAPWLHALVTVGSPGAAMDPSTFPPMG